ncbi:hypothetical protein LOCC1_G006734 [Lachnellula occidentalis]|uniref:Fungal N-terminal domain-containing protein n=1 Tax=Lachnellula occidentalis TaxID=215460 RepID=A0A8H8RK13_9HELO|nr:hypothetical protein LOCC1_G006734 [Lachnellula occidentalis]
MSFGFSVGDFMQLTQLAFRVVQNARKACGAHDDLAREIGGLHIVLRRVEVEVSKPNSILNNNEDNRRGELERLAKHCARVLSVLEQILDKYNALSIEKRSVTKLWQKVKFGNGEMLDLGKIREELATHTQSLNMFLNLLSIGSQGKVEKYMDSHGEDLRDIKHSLHWVTASMQAKSHEEKSILTTYGDDDKAIWKAFRRELIEEGFSVRLLDTHKSTIKKYVMELGARGALDEPIHQTLEEDTQTQSMLPPERLISPLSSDSSFDSDRPTSPLSSDSSSDSDTRVGEDLTQLENSPNSTAMPYHPQQQESQQGQGYLSRRNEKDEHNQLEDFPDPTAIASSQYPPQGQPPQAASPQQGYSNFMPDFIAMPYPPQQGHVYSTRRNEKHENPHQARFPSPHRKRRTSKEQAAHDKRKEIQARTPEGQDALERLERHQERRLRRAREKAAKGRPTLEE